MRRMGVTAAALAAIIAVGCNRSDNKAANGSAVGTAGRADSSVSSGDKDFVRDVSAMNMAEMELSRTALQKSAGADVKRFAQMMIDDHTAAGAKLKPIAAQHQIEVPAQLDDKHRDQGEKLAAKQGLDFDKDYADAMVDGHQDFVDKLESRIDKDTLSKWRASRENTAHGVNSGSAHGGNATATPNAAPDAKVEAMTVTAEKSDDPTTMAINRWAAETYPVAYAHLEAAKLMRDGVKKRSTN